MHKGKFIYAFALFMLCQSIAHGAALNTPVFDRDTETARVSGTADANTDVTIEVLKPNLSWSDIDDENIDFEKLAYLKQSCCGDDGKFSFEFPIKSGAGTYSVRVYLSTEDEYLEYDNLKVFTKSDIDNLVERIASIDKAADFAVLLDDATVEILDLNVEKIKALSASDQSRVFEIMLNEKNEKKPSSVKEIQAIIDRAYLVLSINTAESSEKALELLESNEAFIGFDDECSFNIYSNPDMYDDERKLSVVGALINDDYKTLSAFKSAFGDKVLLYALYNQENYHIIGDVLSESKIAQGLDLKKYNSFSDKSSVQKKLNSRSAPFETVEKLESAINEYCTEKKSSGSGGGGGGGGSKSTPVAVLPADNKTDNASAGNKKKFADMQGFEWAEEAVYALRDENIVSGKTEDSFCPSDNITREEFLKLLVRLTGIDTYTSAASFDDVSENAWYYKDLCIAVENNIAAGKSDRIFGTGESITREDMAVMTYRTLKRLGIDLSGERADFADMPEVSDYALEAVSSLAGDKIINGTGGGKFEPKAFANRASATQIIYNAYMKAGRKQK